jgi:hypothetical protein
MKSGRCIGVWIVSVVAIAFGLLTIKSGGSVLFIDGAGRAEAGNYVPFVLWFNFLGGFVYLIAGVGLWLQKHWAVWLSVVIALATLVVFAVFGMHILQGGLFEQRTVGAMTLRSIVWSLISLFAYRKILR